MSVICKTLEDKNFLTGWWLREQCADPSSPLFHYHKADVREGLDNIKLIGVMWCFHHHITLSSEGLGDNFRPMWIDHIKTFHRRYLIGCDTTQLQENGHNKHSMGQKLIMCLLFCCEKLVRAATHAINVRVGLQPSIAIQLLNTGGWWSITHQLRNIPTFLPQEMAYHLPAGWTPSKGRVIWQWSLGLSAWDKNMCSSPPR